MSIKAFSGFNPRDRKLVRLCDFIHLRIHIAAVRKGEGHAGPCNSSAPLLDAGYSEPRGFIP